LNRLDDPRGCFGVDAALARIHAFPSIYVSSIGAESLETTCHLRIESIERFSGDLVRVKRELDESTRLDHVLIACHNDAEARRLGEVFADSEVARSGRLHLDIGHVRAGFRILLAQPESAVLRDRAAVQADDHPPRKQARDAREVQAVAQERTALEPLPPSIVVISDHELFHREVVRRLQPRRRYESRAIDSFLDLEAGDFVVHLTHGIGIYRGMELLEKRGQVEEHLVIEFAEATRIYVPASKIELVQKYVGGAKSAPTLSRVGGVNWERRKDRVARAVLDMASDLIELHAVRARN
jgi:transcription-repair coupling factor (superfamily II helicase)